MRPELPDGLLPVFVVDRYEGLQPRLLQELTETQRTRYVDANAAAVRDHLPADGVFANHVLLGGPVAAATGAPFAVKAHGSELEYSMRGNADLAAWGRRALAGVRAVFVGSDHIARVLTEVVGAVDNVRRVPPGVDVDEFHPEDRGLALRALLEECRRDPANPGGTHERLPDPGNADKLAAFFATEEPSVLYFGKLLYNKGVHLLFEALERVGARAVIVGFGDYRAQLETQAPANALFTGPLEHRHLVHLIPLCDVAVVPSIFPEAFGMVAAEAAAAGTPPLVAHHSGLAEVAAAIEAEYPPERTGLASFTTGDAADLAAKLSTLLGLTADERRELGLAARRAVVARFSWPAVAAQLLDPFV